MQQYIINDSVLSFSEIQVMGILNCTTDSFFDGGKYVSIDKAIDHVANMVRLGADFIDVGGESTRPGSIEVDEDEELCRVVPVVDEISRRFDVFISVNTSKALVMRESAEVGAHLINDVRSLSKPGTMEVFLDYPKLSICLMHMQGSPDNMQKSPRYNNVVQEVNDYFVEQINRCEFFGISRNRLLIDLGFGFGKTLFHNYKLLANLMSFRHFKLPLLVGISRKSMLDVFGDTPPRKRLIVSISSAVIAAMQGVQILRVHDVKETIEALRIVRATIQENRKIFSYGSK
ncbi:dihydropteroate synthase [Blochmannia endosymbiont of Polyrhachis (Hedomyrma) turneri]|nr:dihydropteroate synthase [Blochmannia endosymbiont of Polyrhachis (Hedomyrma) turneri]